MLVSFSFVSFYVSVLILPSWFLFVLIGNSLGLFHIVDGVVDGIHGVAVATIVVYAITASLSRKTGVGFICLVAVIWSVEMTRGVHSDTIMWIFFLLILPLSNSFADFLSFEISRFLARKACDEDQKMRITGFLLMDYALAIGLILLTAFFIVSGIECYNYIAIKFLKTNVLIDWKPMAMMAKEHPFSYGIGISWMLLSTILWTAIHIMYASILWLNAPFHPEYFLTLYQSKEISNIKHTLAALWYIGNFFVCVLGLCLLIIFLFGLPIFLWILGTDTASWIYNFVIKYHIAA